MMGRDFIKCGNNIFCPSDVAAVSWRILDPKDNCGVELTNWYRIVFKSSHQTLEVSGDYKEIKEQVEIIRDVMMDGRWVNA